MGNIGLVESVEHTGCFRLNPCKVFREFGSHAAVFADFQNLGLKRLPVFGPNLNLVGPKRVIEDFHVLRDEGDAHFVHLAVKFDAAGLINFPVTAMQESFGAQPGIHVVERPWAGFKGDFGGHAVKGSVRFLVVILVEPNVKQIVQFIQRFGFCEGRFGDKYVKLFVKGFYFPLFT